MIEVEGIYGVICRNLLIEWLMFIDKRFSNRKMVVWFDFI